MTRWSTSMLVWLAAWPAAGQAPPPTESPADEALEGAREALAESSPGRAFELARLARSFDPSRSVEAWELMGRAASEMGEQAAAHRFFRHALAFASGLERDRLLARMQLARDELGVVRVDVQPGGAQLLVDGQPAELEVGERVLLLRPGARRLEAQLEGYEPRFAVVQVTPGSEHVLHLVLEEGGSQTARPAAQPDARTEEDRWLAGNATLMGLGGLGLAASGSARALVPELREPMALQVGLSFGLVLGAGLNVALQAAFDPEASGDLMFARMLAAPVFVGAALAVATAGWSRACEAEIECVEPQDGEAFSGAVGTILGLGVATLANVGLSSHDTPLSLSLGIAFGALAMIETALTIDSATLAGALRAEAAAQGGDDAIAMHAEAATRDDLAIVSGGLALGFTALAATSFALGFAGGGGTSGLQVAAGPGTLSVSGQF